MRKLLLSTLLGGALGWSQTESPWGVLKKGLRDSNPEKRMMAATALGGAGAVRQAIALLEEAMVDDKDPEVRQAAASSLGDMKARTAIPKLKAAMENDLQTSFAAARALWNMGDRSGRELIGEVASGEQKNPTGKIAQAKLEANRRLHDPSGLAIMGAEQAAGAFLGPFSIGLRVATELRKDAGAPGRLIAVLLLAQECSAADIVSIETALDNDKNDGVRAGAAKALGMCGGKGAMTKLEPLLNSEKYPVQLTAAASIVRLQTRPSPQKK